MTGQLTAWIAHNGVYAVFALMALDAVAPAGGEVIMLFAGAVAAGAIAGAQTSFLGGTLAVGMESYVGLALAGSVGYLAGSLVGWGVGRVGGRTLIERRGRWLHVSPQAFDRAERWFQRHGPAAVFLGRLTPVVRSFISIPAGVLGAPLLPYTVLTLLGRRSGASRLREPAGRLGGRGRASTMASATRTTRPWRSAWSPSGRWSSTGFAHGARPPRRTDSGRRRAATARAAPPRD